MDHQFKGTFLRMLIMMNMKNNKLKKLKKRCNKWVCK